MKVSIVIPNWNGSNLLQKHLSHVIAHAEQTEIVVVDDASTDDSLTILKNKFPTVHVIAKSVHEGFASTVNVGVATAHGDIIVLLNTDVEPHKDFLKPLTVHFNDSRVFAVACMDESMENDTKVLRGRGEAAWKKGFFVHRRGEIDKSDTAWVSGGSGAFRKSLWIKFGGMSTLFDPFYWEDIDLSYRALKAGYRLIFESKSVVTHFHEEGNIRQAFSHKQVKQIAYRNQFIFIWKNFSEPKIILAHLFWLPTRLFQSFIKWDIAFIRGYISALIFIPRIIASRQTDSTLWKKTDSQIHIP